MKPILVPLALLPLLVSGCLIGSESHTSQEGRRISQQTLDRVQPGHSEEYVLALLGEPNSRTPVEAGRQVWRWDYRQVKQSEGAVFLLVAKNSKTEESGAVFVEFHDDHVVRAWRD